MNDTPPEVDAIYRRMLLSKSGAERVRMASAMFNDARRIIESSIRAADPDIDEIGLRQAVFLRFYGHEFAPPERERILEGIAAAWRRSQGPQPA